MAHAGVAGVEVLASRKALIARLMEEDPFCPAPPEEALGTWSEARLRAFFEGGGIDLGGGPSVEIASPTSAPTLTREQVFSKYPVPPQADFNRWFPGLERSKTHCPQPKMRLLCFANAGNEENVYTNEGLGTRRAPQLLDWCRANRVEMLAPQLPGRALRSSEPFVQDVQTAAAQILAQVATRLFDVPYCVVAHSVGTWIAFEMLARARHEGLPMPQRVFFSCFPAPCIPMHERPWKAQRGLDDDGFKCECRGWDVSDALLADPRMWSNYVALMRSDFTLFDEYIFTRDGDPPFTFPIDVFFAEKDRKVTRAMVEHWRKFTTGGFAVHAIGGHHLFVLATGEQRAAKEQWLGLIVDGLKRL